MDAFRQFPGFARRNDSERDKQVASSWNSTTILFGWIKLHPSDKGRYYPANVPQDRRVSAV
jgi:hypothetical protein